ncbi:hypothetical protein M409DRAFT_61341 [Zasmidium cellare ATCC 36951]|uniref:Uncharacterized protein n=1 Tax=Zasmidium cellare ATCC 36951 TaxID=1080233 RepID=A0A6A6BVK9_ZASCE|nr:uncharacterized protein M409DRAFT_61341 [Zasmidium cellare ATCC 36951]KAF2158837.1 hypothetical protein M409DRAFT_61341 [Zasmidium cellare ATCC 36951]
METPNPTSPNTDLLTINETQCTIDLWDTPGQEFEHFRDMPDYIDVEEELAYAYALADVFIICFAVCDPESFRDVRGKWYPELQQSRPGVPVILAGTKLDFRDDPSIIEMLRIRDKVPVTSEEGKQMAESIGARAYIECSAKTHEGVHRVMDAVACFLR